MTEDPESKDTQDEGQAANGSSDPVVVKLQALGVSAEVIEKVKSDLGAETVEDLSALTEKDLVDCGMKPLPARKVVAILNPPTTEAAPVGPFMPPRVSLVSAVRLQDIPQASSWLSALCAIQPQRIQPLTVVTGIKAAMADVYGYFQLPRQMMRMLREAADSVGEGVPDLYFELQGISNARRYGALVAWMQRKGAACTVAERSRFLVRMHQKFWDSLDTFYGELEGWRKGRRESQDVGESLTAAFSGETQIYEATPVRNAALALGDTINRVFSGTGVYAATALALDNDMLQKVLAEMDFRQFGVQSREQLLAQLGCSVPAEIMAAETTISKFVWNAMLVKDQAAGGVDEQRFLIELSAIGTSRPWAQIKSMAMSRRKEGLTSLTGIGGRGRNTEEEFDEEEEDELVTR